MNRGAEPDGSVAETVWNAIIDRIARPRPAPLVVGICGAQGSGKSTLTAGLLHRLSAAGIAGAALSLDDLYLTRAERLALATEIHPLLATRGPPGTHDVQLGLDVIAALERGEAAPLPRFDKALDDRAVREDWTAAPAACQVLLLEGWCVGARPQVETALAPPVNALEAAEDADGCWRRYVNRALAGDYQRLFGRLDLLVLLAAPCFEVVFEWRCQQEDGLRAVAPQGAPGLMDSAAIRRFIQHYERLTRHILAEMPARADVLITIREDRSAIRP